MFVFPSARENDWGCMYSLLTEGVEVYPSTDELTFRSACFAYASYGWRGEVKLVLDRIEDSPDGRRLHAHVEHPDLIGWSIHYAFLQGVPEPVEVRTQEPGGRSLAIVLDGFQRGTGPPLSRSTQTVAGSWDAVAPFGESPAWPMSDGGSGMDLTFAAAFAAATTHPACGEELARFEAEHPDAFAFMAQSSTHIRDDGATRRAWWFRFGDAVEARDFEVSFRSHAIDAAECAWDAVAYCVGQVRPGAHHDWGIGWPTMRALLDNYGVLWPDAPAARDIGWQIGCFGPCGPGAQDFRHVHAGTVDYLYGVETQPGQGPAGIVAGLVSKATLSDPDQMEMRLLAWSGDVHPWTLLNRAHAVPAARAAELAPPPPPEKAEAGLPMLEAGSVAFDWSASRVAWWVTMLGGAAGLAYYMLPIVREAPLLGLFSRVRQEDLLRSDVRQRIHDAIGDEPGIHLRQLSRRTGMPVGTVRHHLAKLVEAQLIVSYTQGRYTCYSSPKDGPKPAVKGATAAALMQLVAASPGIRQAEVARRLGVTPATVHRHVTRLCAQGLLIVQREGNAVSLKTV